MRHPALPLLALLIAPLPAQVTELVSIAPGGLDGDGASTSPTISSDGRYVCFVSAASNLTSSIDFNQRRDAFVKDLATGEIEAVSLSAVHGQLGNGHVEGASMTPDGRYIMFISRASDLVLGDTNGVADVFVHDRSNGSTERVSVDALGIQTPAGVSYAEIDPSGRYIAFAVNGNAFGVAAPIQVFLKDRVTGELRHISRNSAGFAADEPCYPLSVSPGGTRVLIVTDATNLSSVGGNGDFQLYVYDRPSDTIELGLRSMQGGLPDAGVGYCLFAGDDRHVFLDSDSGDVHPHAISGTSQVYRLDLSTGGLDIAVRDAMGVAYSVDVYLDSVSDDGRHVGFVSRESLAPGDVQNGTFDVYVAEYGVHGVTLASVNSAGIAGSSGTAFASGIAWEGDVVVFESNRSSLVPGDSNGVPDIFVRKAGAAEVGTYGSGQAGAGGTPSLSFEHLPIKAGLPRLVIENTSSTANPISIVMFGLSPDNTPAPWGTNLAALQRSSRTVLVPGTNLVPLTFGAHQVPVGYTVYFQALVQDSSAPNGLASSNGAWMRVGY